MQAYFQESGETIVITASDLKKNRQPVFNCNYVVSAEYCETFTASLRMAERKQLRALSLKTPVDNPVGFKRKSWARDGFSLSTGNII